MKLLLDENLSRRIVPFLEADFPGTSQVALLGLERASDTEIWQYARNNGFCIVTRDADFYDLSLLRGSPPKVVWLRTGNVTRAAIARLLLDNRVFLEERLADVDITCVELY